MEPSAQGVPDRSPIQDLAGGRCKPPQLGGTSNPPIVKGDSRRSSCPQDTTITERSTASTETQVTTTFESDREAVSSTPQNKPTLPGDLATVSSIPFSQDLKSFLGKWVSIGSGTITAASTGQINFWSFPEDLLFNNIYSDKLVGFQGIKGTILVKVLINGTQFQQGRLLLVFHPQAQVTGVNAVTRLQHLTTLTQLPHVEIDICCDSEAVIEIPYISPTLFYNLFTGAGPWGRLYMYVYSSLLTGSGSVDCTYSVWACFDPKTVQLFNPAKATLFTSPASLEFKPQMQARSRKPRRRGWENAGKPPEEQEDEAISSGPISSALNLTSKVAGVASLIPSLTAIAAPVSWATRVGAKVASAFGFSGPLDTTAVTKHERRFGVGWNNCDTPDRSQVVGLFQDNKLEFLPAAGLTEQDEMAIDYLVTRKAYYSEFDWTEAKVEGDILFQVALRPIQFQSSAGVGAASVAWRCPIAGVGTLFDLWRGDYVLTFKLVKTDLHTGRLMVVFYPGLSSAPATFSDNVYCHRAIIDISCGNEFEYVFPYCSERPYLGYTEVMGCVVVYVINALKFPDVVANQISVLVEASGAPGFEFASYKPDLWYPAYITASPMVTKLGPPEEGSPPSSKLLKLKQKAESPAKSLSALPSADVYQPQMLVTTKVPSTADRNACAIQTQESVGGANRREPSLEPAKVCIGERVTSVRQIIQRACGAKGTLTGDDVIRPFNVGLVKYDGVSATALGNLSYDEYSRWANHFMYYRGGVRLKIVTNNTGTLAQARLVSSRSGPVIQASPAGLSSLGNVAWTMDHGTLGGGALQIQVPGILGLHTRIVRPSYTGYDSPADFYDAPNIGVQIKATALPSYATILRQGAEDMQFYYFLGFPPVQLAPTI